MRGSEKEGDTQTRQVTELEGRTKRKRGSDREGDKKSEKDRQTDRQ